MNRYPPRGPLIEAAAQRGLTFGVYDYNTQACLPGPVARDPGPRAGLVTNILAAAGVAIFGRHSATEAVRAERADVARGPGIGDRS